MKRNLPPMNSWVTFEAAARLQSFKAGGEELNITSSAVSHQIRRLEDWLGFKLFERSIRAIALTGAGRRYFNGVTSLLKRLRKLLKMKQHGYRIKRSSHCRRQIQLQRDGLSRDCLRSIDLTLN